MSAPFGLPGPLLAAVNFTERSRHAARAAAAIARRTRQPLYLVHVLPAESVVLHEAALRMAAGALTAEAEPLRREGVDVQPVVLSGRPEEALGPFCREHGVRTLFLGVAPSDDAFGGAAKTAERALQRLDLPLVVVKDAAPFEAFAKGERPLEVLLGMDRTAPTEAAIGWLESLSAVGPLALVAAHLQWPFEEARRLGLPPPENFEDVGEELRRPLEQELRQRLGPTLRERARVRLGIAVGRVADTLCALAEEEGSALLVVGTHRRKGLGKLWSVSHHALRSAPCAVACIPRDEDEAHVTAPNVVLAATDLSEAGSRALAQAAVTVREGGLLHVLHIDDKALSEQERSALRERLRAVAARRLTAGARLEVEVVPGNAAKTILATGERLGADLICLGTHQRSAPGELLLGSVASDVVRGARRPVLLVPSLPR